MKNPLEAIQEQAEAFKSDIERRLRITFARESIEVSLSRLIDLDPGHEEVYEQMQELLKLKK